METDNGEKRGFRWIFSSHQPSYTRVLMLEQEQRLRVAVSNPSQMPGHYDSNKSRKHKSEWHYSHNESSSQWRSRCDFNHISNRDRQCGGRWASDRAKAASCKMEDAAAKLVRQMLLMGVGLQQELQQQDLQQMLQLPQSSGQPEFRDADADAPSFWIPSGMGTRAFTFT